MRTTLKVGGLAVLVSRKDIKNVHLSVHPPTGRVTVSAPRHLSIAVIRAFVIARLEWIRRQQRKLRQQERETKREYIDRESHHVWGRRYLLRVIEKDETPLISIKGRFLLLQVRPDTGAERRRELLEDWYRVQLREALVPLLAKWERRFGVSLAGVHIQRMRTKWGSCNAARRTIRLNTDLARKPRECLEYIVVHELAHFLVRRHDDQFLELMDRHLPSWKHLRQLLNSMPLAHTEWDY